MKHTPGEWTVSGKCIVNGDICIAIIEDDGGYEAPIEQQEANAILIAAAPKLLESLIRIVEFTGAHGGPYAEARAVIAKATGEAT